MSGLPEAAGLSGASDADSGLSEESGLSGAPEAVSGSPEDSRLSKDSRSSKGSEVSDPLDGSTPGNCAASGDVSGAGSSKAGRAWCQGASELWEVVGALPGRLSPRSDRVRWLALPCDALRDRRGPADGVDASAAEGSETGVSCSGPDAADSEPGAEGAWSPAC